MTLYVGPCKLSTYRFIITQTDFDHLWRRCVCLLQSEKKITFLNLKFNSSGSSGYSSGSSQQSSSSSGAASSSSTLDSKVETNGGKWVWSEVSQKYEWEAGAKQVRSPHFNLCTDPILIYWSDNRIHLGLSNSGFSPPPLV